MVRKIKKVENKDNMADMNIVIQSFPSFDGKKESNIDFFLKEFDLLLKTTKFPDEVKLIILKSKLTGIAREFITNNPIVHNQNNYDEFKKALTDRFKKETTFEEAQLEFQQIRQNPNEELNDFINRFELAAAKFLFNSGHIDKPDAVSFIEKTKLSRFLDAIRQDIALEIRKTAVNNFEQAVKIAKRIELAYKRVNNEDLNVLNKAQTLPISNPLLEIAQNQNQQILKLNEEINNLKLAKNTEQKQDEKFCQICDKKSHNIENCWFNAKSKEYQKKQNRINQKKNIIPHNFTYENPSLINQASGQNFQNFTHTLPQQNFQSNYIPQNNFHNQMPQSNFRPRMYHTQNMTNYAPNPFRQNNSQHQNFQNRRFGQTNNRGQNNRYTTSKYQNYNSKFQGKE